MRISKWIGAVLAGGLLLQAAPASAELRWPWEKPKQEKKEKKEAPKTTTGRTNSPAPVFTGRVEDQQMIPRLVDFYGKQLDLADDAAGRAGDPAVRALAKKLQRESERAMGVLHERSRSIGLAVRPHVRQSVRDRITLGPTRPQVKPQSGGADAAADLAFLREVMANVDGIRPDFANYKMGNSDREFGVELRRMFDEELVANREEAKAQHDRIRNALRSNERSNQ